MVSSLETFFNLDSTLFNASDGSMNEKKIVHDSTILIQHLPHHCCELVLTQKKVAKHFIGKNGSSDI